MRQRNAHREPGRRTSDGGEANPGHGRIGRGGGSAGGDRARPRGLRGGGRTGWARHAGPAKRTGWARHAGWARPGGGAGCAQPSRRAQQAREGDEEGGRGDGTLPAPGACLRQSGDSPAGRPERQPLAPRQGRHPLTGRPHHPPLTGQRNVPAPGGCGAAGCAWRAGAPGWPVRHGIAAHASAAPDAARLTGPGGPVSPARPAGR